MKSIYRLMLLAAIAGALVLGVTAGTKNPVQLPLAWKSTGTVVVDFSQMFTGGPITWKVVSETGTMEHLGLYTSNGEGLVVFDQQGIMGKVGDGYLTAANGDKVFWHAEQWGDNPFVLTFSKGTGRFLNATGTATEQAVDLLPETWDGPLLTVTQSLTGTGTISY